jgi:hypothetical protein
VGPQQHLHLILQPTDNGEGIRIVDTGGSTDLIIYSASAASQIPSLNIYAYNTTDLQGLSGFNK